MGPLAVLCVGMLIVQGPGPLPALRPSDSFARLLSQGILLHSQGEFENSLAVLGRALETGRTEAGPDGQAKCLLRLGLLKWDLGDLGSSGGYFDEAATLFEKAGDAKSREFSAMCLALVRLYGQALADRQAGLTYRSADRLAEALKAARETGIAGLQLRCLRQSALTHLALGELDLFLAKSLSGLKLAEMSRHRLEQGRCLKNVGAYYQLMIDYSQAVEYLEQALATLRPLNDPVSEAECLNNLGLVYRELGNLDRAEVLLSEALERDRALGDRTAEAMDLGNIGSVLLRRGLDLRNNEDLTRALASFRESLRLQQAERLDPLISYTALNNMGVILTELEDFPEARRCLALALKIVEKGDHDLERSHALVNLAASYLKEGKTAEALAHFRSAYGIGGGVGFEHVLIESCLGLGQCFERTGDPDSALAFYQQATRALEDIKARLSEPLLTGFSRNKFTAYEKAIGILATRYERSPSETLCESLFDLVERAKARAFLESLRQARSDLQGADLVRLRERQKSLAGNIAELSKRLHGPGTLNEERAALAREIEQEEEEAVRLASKIKDPGPARAQVWAQEVRPLPEIQRLLRDSQAVMLEYYLGEPSSYLLCVAPGTTRLYRLPGQRELERSLRAYLKGLSDPSMDPRLAVPAAERVSRELLPLEDGNVLRTARNLIVVPDGILHGVPFEALRVRGPNGPRYLLEGPAVSYCPSASALAALTSRGRPRTWARQVLAVGSPDRPAVVPAVWGQLPRLPFSRREIDAIARSYPAAVDALTGDEASEANVKARPLEAYRLIHFACHGHLDDGAPLRSSLVLASGPGMGDDGLLQMREIYDLSLTAELVVLSACQTGTGRLERSEGPQALARPFFFAGARAVMASLWPIGDRPAVPLMREFYGRLSEGQPAAEALRGSKLAMLRSRWAHPFYWAALLLQGDPSASAPGSPDVGLPNHRR